MNEVYEVARRVVVGGTSIIPTVPNGSKAPAVPSWAEYQDRLPTEAEIERWWYGRDLGIAIIGGPVSGGLEILDIESAEAWDQFRAVSIPLLRDAGIALPPLVQVETPKGGRHLYYRHTGEQQGNRKLTRWLVDGTPQCVIETRGQGGYAQTWPSPAACHPSGKPYRRLRGDPGAVPTISGEARDVLIEAALSLSQAMEPEQVIAPRTRVTDGTRPGDVYNSRAEWAGLLRRHGWRLVRTRAETMYWTRPGKERGISASTNHAGTGYLYVWSSNAVPFESDRAYSLFAAYSLLDHGGDFRAAAVALAEQGYVAPQTAPVVTERGPARSVDEMVRRRMLAGGVR